MGFEIAKATVFRYAIGMVAIIALSLLALTDAPKIQAQQGVAQDRSALVALYDATGGDNWTNNTNWKSAQPLNQWYGVRTDNSGRVKELILTRNNLQGTMPAALGNLSNLENLQLWVNSLTGSVPKQLGNLTKLKYLDLGENSLSGSIPPEIANARSLTFLDIWSNSLTGSIPEDLGNLSQLRTLALSDNSLSGSIPEKLGDLTSLETLSLWGNSTIEGSIPTALGSLSNLRILWLGGNSLTGSIPSELGNLRNLTSMHFADNALTGEVPSELGNLKKLEELDLDTNALTGSIPQDIFSLSNLTKLDFSDNQMTGIISWQISRLTNLEHLSLHTNEFEGDILDELGYLEKLEHVDISENQLTGMISRRLGELSNLEFLSLHSNSLEGAIPSQLGDLQNLHTLWLSGNSLTGDIPVKLKDLTNLGDLDDGKGLSLWDNPGLCAPLSIQQWLSNRGNSVPVCDQLKAQLAQKFAPILRMHKDEIVFPRDVGVMLDEADLRNSQGNKVLGQPNPLTGEYLGFFFNNDFFENYYLDYTSVAPPYWIGEHLTIPLSKVYPDEWPDPFEPYDSYIIAEGRIDQDEYDLTVYVDVELHTDTRLLPFPKSIDQLVLRYWMFYPLDRNHEGDWELIQLEFDANGEIDADKLMARILGNNIEPTRTIYSQHGFMDFDCWGDSDQLTTHGLHPKVFVARGSHASYYKADEVSILGKLLGLHSVFDYFLKVIDLFDVTTDDGAALVPPGFTETLSETQNEYALSIIDSATSPWFEYKGIWGEVLDRRGRLPNPIADVKYINKIPFIPKDKWIEVPLLFDDGSGGLFDGPLRNYARAQSFPPASVALLEEVTGFFCKELGSVTLRQQNQSIGQRNVAVRRDRDVPSDVQLNFSWQAIDKIATGQGTLEIDVRNVSPDSDASGVQALSNIVEESDEEIIELIDISLSESLKKRKTTVCIPVPFGFPGDRTILHYDETNGVWERLETFTGDQEHISCAVTDSFSLFALVGNAQLRGGILVLPLAKQASRIEPIVTSVTLSPSDTVRLSTNIFGQQNIRDNSLAEGLTFQWNIDDNVLQGDGHQIEFNAPSSPGSYKVTASLTDHYCTGKHGTCSAEFTIRVLRSSSAEAAVDITEPVNPTGEIPSVLTDDGGKQYEVFTPGDGGRFKGDTVSLLAMPGVVPNGEIIGLRISEGGVASNVGKTHQRYNLGGSLYEISAVDASGNSLSSYRLNNALEVCIPLPAELRKNISKLAILANNSDDSLTALSATARITSTSLQVCGKISSVPATIAAGSTGAPAAIPTAVPDADDASDLPETGGEAPWSTTGLIITMLFGLIGLVVGVAVIRSQRRGRTRP